MELLLVVFGLLLLVGAYFFVGILIKFLLGWWIMVIGVPVLILVGLALGWIGAIAALVGFGLLLTVNSQWQGSTLYGRLEHKVDKAFYFADS